MLSAKDSSERSRPRSIVTKTFDNGVDYIVELESQDRLGRIVVVHLGTNGPIGQSEMDRLMEAVTDVKKVLLLTIDVDRDYAVGNNSLIFDTASRYANVDLLDWQGLVSSCPGNCLYEDGFHLRPDGQQYYADLIAQSVGIS